MSPDDMEDILDEFYTQKKEVIEILRGINWDKYSPSAVGSSLMLYAITLGYTLGMTKDDAAKSAMACYQIVVDLEIERLKNL